MSELTTNNCVNCNLLWKIMKTKKLLVQININFKRILKIITKTKPNSIGNY